VRLWISSFICGCVCVCYIQKMDTLNAKLLASMAQLNSTQRTNVDVMKCVTCQVNFSFYQLKFSEPWSPNQCSMSGENYQKKRSNNFFSFHFLSTFHIVTCYIFVRKEKEFDHVREHMSYAFKSQICGSKMRMNNCFIRYIDYEHLVVIQNKHV